MRPTDRTSLSAPVSPTEKLVRCLCYGLVAWVFSWSPIGWADGFDAALANCAQQVKFCEKESYDGDICKAIPATLKPCKTTMSAGTLCILKLDAVVPTQPSVGRHVAVCKAKRLRERAEKTKFKKGLTRYLLRAKRHVPTIIGPENPERDQFYITDHHHLAYAMQAARDNDWIDSGRGWVTACILTNRSTDKEDSFWSYMVDHHFAWLDSADGTAITSTELRNRFTALNKLDNYPYRSWSRWVRDSCGYIKEGNDCVPAAYPATAPYFMEFKWADYMHNNLAREFAGQGIDVEDIGSLTDDEIAKVVEVAIELVQGDQAFLQDLPGYSDGTVIGVKRVTIEEGCEADQ